MLIFQGVKNWYFVETDHDMRQSSQFWGALLEEPVVCTGEHGFCHEQIFSESMIVCVCVWIIRYIHCKDMYSVYVVY